MALSVCNSAIMRKRKSFSERFRPSSPSLSGLRKISQRDGDYWLVSEKRFVPSYVEHRLASNLSTTLATIDFGYAPEPRALQLLRTRFPFFETINDDAKLLPEFIEK